MKKIEYFDTNGWWSTILIAGVSLFLFVPGPARSANSALVRHCSVCTYYYLHERICAGGPSTRGTLSVSPPSPQLVRNGNIHFFNWDQCNGAWLYIYFYFFYLFFFKSNINFLSYNNNDELFHNIFFFI